MSNAYPHTWTEQRVESLAESVAMGPFGSNLLVSGFVDSGIPVISGEHLNDSRIREHRFNYVTEKKADSLGRANAYRGDVIFTHAGNIGQVSYIPEDSDFERYIISQRQFKMTCDRTKVIPEYVTYFFRSPAGQHLLLANASQTGVPSIARPVTYLRSINVPVPPLREQRAIAEILGALDDKIELNREMNATLDELARTIFRSWFVDFDPVRAKMEGRAPFGMDAETAALFPDRLVDSALGPIPEGWRITTFGDIAQNVRDNVPTADLSAEEPYVGLEHFSKRSIALPEWASGESVTSNKSRFREADVLFGRLRPYFHKVAVAPVSGVCSTEILVIRPKDPSFHAATVCIASSDEMVARATAFSSGTRMPRAKWSDLATYQLVLPETHFLPQRFEDHVSPMIKLILQNVHESRTLAELRDTLLPELISGRIRVPDAERLVGEAV